MFHRVCPKSSLPRVKGNSGLEVTPEYLEQTILFLRKKNYEIVSLNQAVQILKGHYIKKKFVVFTFDDGYVDNYLHAYPIFKKHSAPFVIYITTHLPDGKAILWWYLLEDLIVKENEIKFRLNGNEHQYPCTNPLEKDWAYHQIHQLILNGPSDQMIQRIQQIFTNYPIDLTRKTLELSLSWEQIREMSLDPLVEIGAHTINHQALNTLPESVVQEQMEGSRKKIESEIGQRVDHFCYPFGTHNEVGEREFRIAKKCGFKTSTTTRPANIFPEHKDLLEQLPRITVNQKRDNGNIEFLSLWLNGALPCLVNKFKRVV
tara:strand:+ start:76 stop:1026 length:951 start_codon:yes stop_codon:yes gene_type:complete